MYDTVGPALDTFDMLSEAVFKVVANYQRNKVWVAVRRYVPDGQPVHKSTWGIFRLVKVGEYPPEKS